MDFFPVSRRVRPVSSKILPRAAGDRVGGKVVPADLEIPADEAAPG